MTGSTSNGFYTLQWSDTSNTNGTHFIITTTTSSNSPYVKTFQKDLPAADGSVKVDSDGSVWIFQDERWQKLPDQFIIKEII